MSKIQNLSNASSPSNGSNRLFQLVNPRDGRVWLQDTFPSEKLARATFEDAYMGEFTMLEHKDGEVKKHNVMFKGEGEGYKPKADQLPRLERRYYEMGIESVLSL